MKYTPECGVEIMNTEKEQGQGTAGGSLMLRIEESMGTETEIACDTVRLFVADGEDGSGGGFLGIRKGHARALIALGSGMLRAKRDGETVYEDNIPGGFALVERDTVTVFADRRLTEPAPADSKERGKTE